MAGRPATNRRLPVRRLAPGDQPGSGYGETLTGGLGWDTDYFRVKSVARRLAAGTGSLGTPRFYLLIEGPSADQDDDVILDVKRQGTPTAHAYITPVWNFATRPSASSPISMSSSPDSDSPDPSPA